MALATPAFQTKSKRNLFSDAPVAPAATSAMPRNIFFSSDLSGIEIEPVTGESPEKLSSRIPKLSRSSSKSPSKSSSKSPKKRSPFKSPMSKSLAASGGESFFGKMFCAIGYGSMSGKYRPAPVSKGVYHDNRCKDIPPNSVKTLDTTLDAGQPICVPDWIASNLQDHSRGVPYLVRKPEYDSCNEPDDKKLLKEILLKSRKLPQEPGKYASNHIMVNHERTKRNIPPLRRERYMDQIAREHAELLAKEKQIFLIDNPLELRNRLIEKDRETNELPVFERVGMNIGRGKDIAEVHRFMMAALAERNNVYDKRFFSMGMGTYIAENGMLYMCQVFGGY